MATPQKTANKAAPAAQAKPAARPAQPAGKPAAPAQNPKAQAQAQTRPAAPNVQTRVQAPIDTEQKRGEVVTRETTAVATQQDVPDYIRGGPGRGSENVEMQDMVIPRIELVQALSKCLEEGGSEYIEGAKPGMFYNSVTRELYGSSVTVCPVFFKKQYLCWRDRKKGGGFGGAYDTMQEAQTRIEQTENPDEWEAIETAQQILLVVDRDTHETSEAVLSCARTKQKVSRQWNSLIRIQGNDRFSRIYDLFGTDETNSQNQAYKNIGVHMIDFASMPVFKAAEALYNSIASGARAVKIDDTYIDAGMGAEDETPPGAQAGDPGASTEY
jgi:hypothetical protein